MKLMKLCTVLLILLTLAVQGGPAGAAYSSAPPLPAGIRSYLNENYAGWRLVTVASGCGREFKGAFAAGDFDGDGKRDYIVKFVRGRRGYVMAFLERHGGYEAHVLHGNLSAAEIRNTGISVFRKGERIPVGDEESNRQMRLANDAPFDGPCESDAGGVHIYRNGRFVEP